MNLSCWDHFFEDLTNSALYLEGSTPNITAHVEFSTPVFSMCFDENKQMD